MTTQCCYCFDPISDDEQRRDAVCGGSDSIHERCFTRHVAFMRDRYLPREIDAFRNRFPGEVKR